jgi:hypothetical protein
LLRTDLTALAGPGISLTSPTPLEIEMLIHMANGESISSPESGLFLEDPLLGHDGRWLLYSRGRITDDIWLMNFGKGVNEGLHRRARVFPTPVEIPVVRCAVPLLNSLSWDVVKTFRQWPGDGNLEEPGGLRVDKQCSI